jgi:hypothetical protein
MEGSGQYVKMTEIVEQGQGYTDMEKSRQLNGSIKK